MRRLGYPRRRRVTDLVITSPERHTVIDENGSVRSIQAAVITLPQAALEAMWSPMYLERLARTYWSFLSRATLSLIGVTYTARERSVVLISRPLVLLRFQPPEYELGHDGGVVRWRIRDGLLVARSGHEGDGYLEIEVRRRPCDEPGRANVRVQVEVANFYPAVASWFTRGFYSATQSQIHVMVTHGFLKSLASLKLERSAVGRFDPERIGPAPAEITARGPAWVPAAALALVGAGLALKRRR
jgi:hypothetical protein